MLPGAYIQIFIKIWSVTAEISQLSLLLRLGGWVGGWLGGWGVGGLVGELESKTNLSVQLSYS